MAFELPERFEDTEEMLRSVFEGCLKDHWFAMPVRVHEDSEDMHRVTLEITIKGRVRKPDGSIEMVKYPLLQDVPISFPSGGGATLTFPVKKGMEGYVVCASRGIDNWSQNGDVQEPSSLRLQSLSDGLTFHPIRSDPKKLKGVSKTATQLRSDEVDGEGKPKHFVELDSASGKVTTSVDSGKHVTVHSADAGISHKSTVKVHIEAPKLGSKGTWNHDGGMRTTGVLQSDMGLKSPQVDAPPGSVEDVVRFT